MLDSPWRTNMKKFIPILLSFIITLADVEQITAQSTIPTQTAIIKTRSYAAVAADVGRLIVMNCSTACTLTLPNPVPSPNWTIWVSSIGAGTVRVSPNGLQMNGSSSNLILNAPGGLQVLTDNANYFSILPTQSPLAALKPQSSDDVQYVSANGNDSNDGLSLGTAKRTVYAALLALPGGNGSMLTAGHGTVWIVGNVNYGGPVTGGGFWIMGHLDPNYSSPPRGWLKSSGPISLRAYSPNNAPAQNHMPNSYITAGAGAPDLSKPAMWISGLAAGYWIKDVGWGNYVASNYIRLGICSPTEQFPKGDRSGICGVQQVTIDNSAGNFGEGVVGTGPGIDIGSNTFWIWIRNSAFGGGLQDLRTIASNTGLSRSSNVVMVTTTEAHAFVVGQNVTIFNASDPTFNASVTITSKGLNR